MMRFVQRAARATMLLSLMLFAAAQPAAAQQILRDSETELFLRDISKPLIEGAGLNPRHVQIVMIQDDEINAFVAQGQVVYIHSGLIEAADNANQLEGVIAHELGHVAGGHAIRMNDGVKAATGISVLSILLGVAAAVAGAGEAALGVIAAGQQAAMGNFLSFTRAQEASADEAGSKYLSAAGYSGKGSIEFFKKLQNQEFRLAIPQDNSYGRTHPLSGERIAALEQNYRKDPAWNRPTDPAIEMRFKRIKAKLLGYLDPRKATMAYPESDQSIPAHYARAYAYHRGAYPEKAAQEVKALIAAIPHDPFFLELQGQTLLEGGDPKAAIAPLREAVARAPDQPMIAVMLGHALVASDDPKNIAEAKQVVKSAVNRDNDNPFAWYVLGVAYDREGDAPRAALASAERNNLQGNNKLALASARSAMAGLKPGTPDYLRAQDIAMVSDYELNKNKKKKKKAE
ncbi:M48 family metalloprotease [Sphingomonas rhizophila]|uniref:M48 family metalloprotease n=1 Tax=Sphingomonas rhizophila TaxID=2071607 RepID=A0A7G9S8Z1_9SPHN|nr:M48 family metalloprotease [Sphingomonas rhizophila]QNN64316.1 M48 family metalloprotease [Sphingomonas rhizophila]